MNIMAILMGIICVVIAGIQLVGLDETTIMVITLISCALLSMLIFLLFARQLAKAAFSYSSPPFYRYLSEER